MLTLNKSFLNFGNIFNLVLLIFIVSIPFKNAFYQVSIVLLIMLFCTHVYINKSFDKFYLMLKTYKDLSYLFLLLIFCMFISNLLNSDLNNDSFRSSLAYIYRYGFLLFVLLYFYSNKLLSEKNIIFYIFVSLFIQLLYATINFLIDSNFLYNIENIAGGISGATFSRNQFGFLMGLSIILILLFFKNKYIKLLIPFFLLGMMFSYSRAAWVGVILVIILYSLVNVKKIRLKSFFIFLLIFALLSVLVLNVDSLNVRLYQLFSGYSSGRFEIWIHTFDLISNKLFFGYGLDSWSNYMLKSYSNIHNSILEVLFTLGLVGLTIYMIAIIITVKETFINKKYNLLLVVLYFSIISQFDNSIFYSKIFLSLLVLFLFLIFKNRIDNQIFKEQK